MLTVGRHCQEQTTQMNQWQKAQNSVLMPTKEKANLCDDDDIIIIIIRAVSHYNLNLISISSFN